MSVISISNVDQLNNIITSSNNKPIVIEFSATWCGPCKRIAPHFNQLAQNMKNIIFCKVDINDCEELAMEFNIKSVPTFIFIKDGKIIATLPKADMDALQNICNRL